MAIPLKHGYRMNAVNTDPDFPLNKFSFVYPFFL